VRVLLYSGKGGVGKTSLAAATAVRAARLGHRTLVVSTDAAHSLGDALECEVGPEPTRVAAGLHAVEVDVNRELAQHWGVIHDWLTRFMSFQGVEETVAEEMAVLPGMDELFSLLKVKSIVEAGGHDLVVVDCAPTGDTLRMLGIPEVLAFYFKRIFPVQRRVVRSVRPVVRRVTNLPLPEDDVFGALRALYGQLQELEPLLKDPGRSSIRLVLNPERIVIRESQRLYTYLNLFGFSVDAVIANRVLPEQARGGYLDGWVKIQAGHLEEAARSFEPVPLLRSPLFDREMVGLERLDELARRAFGRRDPAAVFHRETPLAIRKEAGGYTLSLSLPFASRDHLEVWVSGEELIVQVDNQRRHLVLPRVVARRKLQKATLEEGRLRVTFC